MTDPSPKGADNRRLSIRILAREFLGAATSLAKVHGDLIEALVFTGVWTQNTAHLNAKAGSNYSQFYDIPPDAQRRPAPEAELPQRLLMPPQIVEAYVAKLLDKGLCERVPGGLVVPAAVFTRPEMLGAVNETYARMLSMVSALREGGFRFGEDA